MDDLESQVAKIQIGNFKKTTSFVFLLAEKAAAGNAELYTVAELPLLNPAAVEPCEKICLAIAGALRRAYKKSSSASTFESMVAQINEELGKLASLGQANWVDKLSCIVAVKEGDEFYIATCGKIAAYLLRSGEFTDISCSSPQNHPLKPFENIASGKLRLDDCVILSTTQLFNHISVDRLRNILQNQNFLSATQTVIELLKSNAGPEVAFGTILNLQVPFGQTENEQIDLESYVQEAPEPAAEAAESFKEKALIFLKSVFALDRFKRKPAVNIAPASIKQRLAHMRQGTKKLFSKSSAVFSLASKSVLKTRQNLNLEHIKNFSRQKKILFASVIVLAIAVIVNIAILSHLKKVRTTQQNVAAALNSASDLVNKAQSSLLYKDNAGASGFIGQAKAALPPTTGLTDQQKKIYADLQNKIQAVQEKTEKIVRPQVSSLGSLGQSGALLALPPFLAAQTGKTIVSYNTQTGLVQDSALLSSENIIAAAYVKNSTAVVYNSQGLLLWDYSKKTFTPAFSQSVPAESDFAGLVYYPTNQRVYTINKKTNQILSFGVTSNIAKPVVASKNANDLGNALDIAIDGSIYVLNTNGVSKYQAGSLTDFHLPSLATPFSGTGKIYTEKDFKNIYILDAGNRRILVLDKKGNLTSTLVSDQFTKLKSFTVDEKNKLMYVLNDGSLLKVVLP